MKSKEVLLLTVIILSIAILVINDEYLKFVYPNILTGKLSDVIGLFSITFILIWSSKLSNTALCAMVILGFTLWKTSLSNPLINFLNSVDIPVGRIKDMTDLLVLPIILIPIILAKDIKKISIYRPFKIGMILVSIIAFTATTMPMKATKEYELIDKYYQIELPVSTVVSKINSLQLKEIKRYGYYLDFNSENDTYYSKVTGDRVAVVVDHTKVTNQDTVKIGNDFAEVVLYADGNKTSIQLVRVYKTTGIGDERDLSTKAIKYFERKLIKPLEREAARMKEAGYYQ